MIELIRNRRSIRKYTTQAIEPEKIELLQEAMLRSPSSKNSNTWEFIFVDQPEIIQQLATAKPHGSQFLAGAPLAVVVVADNSHNEIWIEDCSIASIFLQMTAQSLGLGSCWVQIRGREHDENQTAGEYVQNLLSIPKQYQVLSVVGVGYPAQERRGKATEELQWHKIHRNIFDKTGQ